MKYSSSKEFDMVIRQLLRERWTYSKGKKHGKLYPPTGSSRITVPGSPSDWRALLNFRRDVREVLRP